MPSKQAMPWGLASGPAAIGLGCVKQTVLYSDFTDGGDDTGTLNLRKQIPAGSFVIGSKVNVLTAFTGDTSCILSIGVSGDSSCYSGNTEHNIYTAANNLVLSAESSPVAEASAYTVLLTAISNSDWGAVTAGKMDVWIYYSCTNAE